MRKFVKRYHRLSRPVIFIGMPRSGTTIVFEQFVRFSEFGWITNYSARFPKWPIVNILRLFLDNSFIRLRGSKQQYGGWSFLRSLLPKPQEAYPFWEEYCGSEFLWKFDLQGDGLSDAARDKVSSVLNSTIRYQGKSRLAAKLTGPSRIDYLRTLFPDAIFVHVIRDGRAVVDSLLRVDFWRDKGGLDKPFWNNALSDNDIEEWDARGRAPVVLAAIEWRNVIVCTRREGASLDDKSYMEVRYEDFVENPSAVLHSLYEATGTSVPSWAAGKVDTLTPLSNMNKKYLDRSDEDIKQMDIIMGELLENLGY